MNLEKRGFRYYTNNRHEGGLKTGIELRLSHRGEQCTRTRIHTQRNTSKHRNMSMFSIDECHGKGSGGGDDDDHCGDSRTSAAWLSALERLQRMRYLRH